MSNKYFGTDGIRGTVNQGNITGEKFFKFGLATATYFKNQKKAKQVAIIAKDTRLSGYTLEPALVSGLASVLYGLSQGVQLFRVHNVKEINQGILVFNKILNTN